MKTLLKYPGAKNRLASWIVSHIPPHKVYCEPFLGSGAVFLNKEPAYNEILNDLSDGMYYEITYNGDKNECYLDAYKKWQNVCIEM